MKVQRIFVVFGSFGGPKLTKRDIFLRVVARWGPRMVPVTLWRRFWVSPGWPGDASGVPGESLGGPLGITLLLLGSLWELSEDLLKVPGIFLDLPEGFFAIFEEFSPAFPRFPSLSLAFPCFLLLSFALPVFPCFPPALPCFLCFPRLSFVFSCFPLLSRAFPCFPSAFPRFPLVSPAFPCVPPAFLRFPLLSSAFLCFGWLRLLGLLGLPGLLGLRGLLGLLGILFECIGSSS